jgi:hypothetical protein
MSCLFRRDELHVDHGNVPDDEHDSAPPHKKIPLLTHITYTTYTESTVVDKLIQNLS